VTTPGAGRLSEDVQRFGLLSAAAVVDRYRQLVDRAMDDVEGDDTITGGLERVDPSWLVDRAARLAGGYLRFLESAASALGSRSKPAGVERLAMPPARPGESAEGSLWVHNPTGASIKAIQLVSTALVSVGNEVIPEDRVIFRPAEIDPVGPGGSAEIGLRVEVPPGASPGRYLGLIHLLDPNDDPIAVDLEVVAR
jgi:hypothetical protein